MQLNSLFADLCNYPKHPAKAIQKAKIEKYSLMKLLYMAGTKIGLFNYTSLYQKGLSNALK